MSVPSILSGYNTIYWSLYLVCITGAISQVILLVCLIKDPLKCFRNSATYLVANLAVCDLAVVSQMIFGTFASRNPWLCSLSHASFYASILTILSISVDRYIMVAHPFKHRLLMNGKKAACWIAFIWILSISCPLYLCLAGNRSNFRKFKYALLAVAIFLAIFMYILTCISLKRQAKSLESKDGRKVHKFRVAREERFLRTVILIVLIALMSLTPATIYGQFKKHGLRKNMERNAVNCILMTLLCLNFSINPIIYFLRLKNYRKTFFILFCCRLKIRWQTTIARRRRLYQQKTHTNNLHFTAVLIMCEWFRLFSDFDIKPL
jgi:hypothetical protein